ncbi:hypothetical protein ONZ45_g16097 [Pleurotus djamor]|nr:hypothetical protein ONZ45_g16097 [Pleurotus djamor]
MASSWRNADAMIDDRLSLGNVTAARSSRSLTERRLAHIPSVRTDAILAELAEAGLIHTRPQYQYPLPVPLVSINFGDHYGDHYAGHFDNCGVGGRSNTNTIYNSLDSSSSPYIPLKRDETSISNDSTRPLGPSNRFSRILRFSISLDGLRLGIVQAAYTLIPYVAPISVLLGGAFVFTRW